MNKEDVVWGPAVFDGRGVGGQPTVFGWSERRVLVVAALFGLALRWGLACWVSPGAVLGPLDDDGYYFALAKNLSDTGVYTDSGAYETTAGWGKMRAFRPPLFPLFLASFHEIFGDFPYFSIRLVLATLSLAVPFAVWWLARRWWGPIPALVGFGWALLHPHFLHYSIRLQNDSLFLPFAAWSIALLSIPRGPLTSFAGGVLTGLATLGRSQFFGAALVGSVWNLAWSKWMERRWWGGLFVVGFLLVVVPWWVRNARVFHRFVPLSTEGGYTLWLGNNPVADGGGDCYDSNVPTALAEVGKDQWHYREAIRYIIDHPRRTLSLAGSKLSRFWAVVPQVGGPRVKLVSALTFVPLFIAAIIGVWIFPFKRQLIPAEGLLLYYTGFEFFFPALMRYRLPLEVILIALGAGALHRLGIVMRERFFP